MISPFSQLLNQINHNHGNVRNNHLGWKNLTHRVEKQYDVAIEFLYTKEETKELNALAKKHKMTRSELIRTFIEWGKEAYNE